MTATNASQSNKAARGTKRVCQECEVRFYDLSREPIVCPSCGAAHEPVARPVFMAGTHAPPVAGKTSWRRNTRPTGPVPPQPDPDSAIRPEAAVAEELEVASEEVADAAPDDDTVLEQEPDDADVSGLIEVDVEEPKER